MSWSVVVRHGPKVERLRVAGLDEALDLAEQRARAIAAGPGRRPVGLRHRRFEPVQQVQARVEVRGPGRLLPRVRAGVDVRGDGSVEAFVGGARRRVVDQSAGETPYAALRRSLASTSVEP